MSNGTPEQTPAEQAQDKRPQAEREAKLRAHQLRNQGLFALSYLIDGATMAAFAWAGTTGWRPAWVYTLTGLLICGAFAAIALTRWPQRLKDPVLALPILFVNASVQFVAMALVPQLAFMFVLLLLLICVTAMLRLPERPSLWALGGVAVALGLLINASGRPFDVPGGTLAEQWIAWAFVVLTLWRCVLVGSVNTRMVRRLRHRSRELAVLTRKMVELAQHDELTGVLNRRRLLALLGAEHERAQRVGTPLSVALIDLDAFKSINDRLGHLAGDRVLQGFAAVAHQATRRTDHFGRYGGEEFLMVLVDTPTEAAARSIERVRQAMDEFDFDLVVPGLRVTFSCGVASLRPGDTVEALLKRADEALYRAKADGRRCTRFDASPPAAATR